MHSSSSSHVLPFSKRGGGREGAYFGVYSFGTGKSARRIRPVFRLYLNDLPVTSSPNPADSVCELRLNMNHKTGAEVTRGGAVRLEWVKSKKYCT